MNSRPVQTVALIDWSHLLEDYLDSIRVTFEEFLEQMTGGWMFGYIEALHLAGFRTLLVCFSSRVDRVERHVHRPTGTTVCLLPAPATYRAIRRRILNPYATTVEDAAGEARGLRRAWLAMLLATAPYTATPLRELGRELKREGCEILLCQDYEHPRFDLCVLLGKRLRMPVFASFQGGNWQSNPVERWSRPLTLRLCAGLIVGSRIERDRIRTKYGLPDEKIAGIFNPVDLSIWNGADRTAARSEFGIPDEAFVAVWHGRVQMERKGLDVLLDAWDRVCSVRNGRDLRLIMVGAGDDSARLNERIDSLGLKGVHRIDSYVTDRAALCRYLSVADCYAFPSRHEGFAVAPLEAMAAGLAVVAADAPGVRDIFEDGENHGGLVVARGCATALAEAIGRLVDDLDWCRTMGERAKVRAERGFSLEAVGRHLRSFITGETRQPRHSSTSAGRRESRE